MKKIAFALFLMSILSLKHADATCDIYNSEGKPLAGNKDALYILLSSESRCPNTVQEFNTVLLKNGLKRTPSMVANRGRNNPKLGSFSFFETVTGSFSNDPIQVKSGDFFYGHFTDVKDAHIILDQSSTKGKLLIELIAWDYDKSIFNFYELRGLEQKSTRWFYRGNSLDALKDNKYVYRDSGSSPKYGSIMRCSACHSSGGPIMKELSFPHNDWWTSKRSLTFGTNQLSAEVADYVKNLSLAEDFATNVKAGINRLETSNAYTNAKLMMSFQEQLRPLFCENEINLESDFTPSLSANTVNIPSNFFVNPMLSSRKMSVPKIQYNELLDTFKMNFPETNHRDSDHPWLTPVKGYSDLLAIQSLIRGNIVDQKFVSDVLSVDFENPIFSETRCNLLKLIPNTRTANWRNVFQQNLLTSKVEGAFELYQQMENQDKNPPLKFKNLSHQEYFLKLLKTRDAVFSSEISKNPKGQILEPGFRVIFPLPNN